jgi:hypothetical protein
VQRLSEEAVLATRYIAAFARAGHLKAGSGWTPCGNWSRDDQLGVDEETAPGAAFYRYLAADGTLAEASAEKERALATWRELMAELDAILAADDARPALARWRELYNSARYGDTWLRATAHHFAGVWQALAWRDGGGIDEALRRAALAHLAAAELG